MGLLFAGSAQAATPPVKLGSDASFSVLAGSTVTNTGPTTMFGDLGLDPGSSVTGAPHTLGAMHIDDGVAIKAKSDLVTAYNDAAGRPSTQLSSADLSGQSFTPGVYNASSSLLFSAGSVTLNAQGDPNAVFIFQRRTRRLAAQRRTERLAKERRTQRLAKLRRAERLRLIRARGHRQHSPARPPSGSGGFTG